MDNTLYQITPIDQTEGLESGRYLLVNGTKEVCVCARYNKGTGFRIFNSSQKLTHYLRPLTGMAPVSADRYKSLEELIDMYNINPSLLIAAKEIIESMNWLYKSHNGRSMSIEDTTGEKCWIVPAEKIDALKAAIHVIENAASHLNTSTTKLVSEEDVIAVESVVNRMIKDVQFPEGSPILEDVKQLKNM